MRQRTNILDVMIDQVDRTGLAAVIDAMVDTGGAHRIVPVNLDLLRLTNHNPEFRELVNTADLVTADGMPLVWVSRLRGDPLPGRVTGSNLVWACTEVARRRNMSIFVMGGLPGVADRAAAALQQRLPDLRIAGTLSPPFGSLSRTDELQMAAAVRDAKADFLFIGMGAPRQEEFIHGWIDCLGVRVCVSVGAVVDFLSGRIPRAPHLLQAAGMEWLFRLMLEPRRLWRRYLLDDLPLFLRLAAIGARNGVDRRFALQLGRGRADRSSVLNG